MNLENRFFYRLVKVIRNSLVAFLFIAIGRYISAPYILIAQLNASTSPTKQELLALALTQDDWAKHLFFFKRYYIFHIVLSIN